jgi:hypothetical protein
MAKLLTGTRIYGTGTVDTQLFVSGTTQAASTNSGALQVLGGIGVGGGGVFGGTVTATNFVGAFSGTVTGAATQVNTIQQASSATYFPTFVDANNASAAAETVFTTSSFVINPGTGNVGIGTSSPVQKLHVNGNIKMEANTYVRGANDAIYIGEDASAYYVMAGTNTMGTSKPINLGANPPLVFITNTVEQVRITTAGNIGIGTSSPASKLHVAGDARITGITTVTNTTVATSTITGAFQVAGGAGIGGALFVSGVANANAFIATGTAPPAGTTVNFSVLSGGAWINSPTGTLGYLATANTGVLSWSGTVVNIIPSTAASSTNTGALTVAGGAGIGGNLYIGGNEFVAGTLQVNSANANTGTNTSNAFYTAGGAWIDKTLVVGGETTFKGSVVFQGTNTFVYSSSTVYTDNLISVHAPLGSTPGNHTWTVDDGKDIGFMFHYYKGADKDAFLGFANDTSYLEWYSEGTESGGVFTGTTYGTFKTGGIRLVSGTANNGNTTTGALQVSGGIGISGGGFFGGTVTATNFVGAFSGAVTGAASQVQTTAQAANATYYPTFVDANNASAAAESLFTTSTFSINPSTGLVNHSTGGILVGDTANTISLQSDYSSPLIIQRSGNSNKGALLLRGSDTIGTAIEFGRSNAASHWGTYFSFYVHDNNTSDPLLSIKEKMRIDATGVGIGNTAPLYKLHINNAATVGTAASVLSNATPILYLDNGGSTNGSVVIKSHNVGNGNVHGAVKFASSPDGTNYSWSGIAGIADANSAASGLALYTATGNAQATAAGASTERMRIDINGNVGIGTSSPAYKLDVFGGTNTIRWGNGSNYGFTYADSQGVGVFSNVNATGQGVYLNNTGNYLALFTNTSGSSTEKVRLDSAGNLGIGTTSPGVKLDVVGGSIRTTSWVDITPSTATNNALYRSTNTGGTFYSGLDNSAGGVTGANYAGVLWHTGAYPISIGTNSAERMRISSTGVVTISSGIASTNTATGALVIQGGVGINGALNAITKSFNISHPTKPGMNLRYGSLEGPEFGVYVRGRLTGSNVIELPEYWSKLVNPDSITVNLTPVGSHQKLYVDRVVGAERIIVGNENLFGKTIDCFYTVYAERADIDPLVVEG